MSILEEIVNTTESSTSTESDPNDVFIQICKCKYLDKGDNLFCTQAAKYVAANLDSFFLTINGSLIILMQVLRLKLWKDHLIIIKGWLRFH